MSAPASSILSGFCSTTRWHERCAGAYAGHPCSCDCHQAAVVPEPVVTERAGCSRCGNRAVLPGDAAHEQRCAAEYTARYEAVELGLRCGVAEHVTTDLWAHLRSGPAPHAETPASAARIVRFLLYLGWRPRAEPTTD